MERICNNLPPHKKKADPMLKSAHRNLLVLLQDFYPRAGALKKGFVYILKLPDFDIKPLRSLMTISLPFKSIRPSFLNSVR